MCRAAEVIAIVLLVNVFALQLQTHATIVSSVQNVIENSPSLRYHLLDQIENFRQGMPCGFPELDIPTLAPFAWKRLQLNTGDNFWLSFDGELGNARTFGFDQFIVRSLQLHLLELQLDFKVLFPVVQTVGKYKAKGKLAGYIPFDRSGQFSLRLYALTVEGSIRFAIEGKHLVVLGLKITPTLYSSQAQFDKMMSQLWINDLFDRAISAMIPNYLQENRRLIAARIEGILKPKFNSLLKKYDIRYILEVISQEGIQFTSC